MIKKHSKEKTLYNTTEEICRKILFSPYMSSKLKIVLYFSRFTLNYICREIVAEIHDLKYSKKLRFQDLKHRSTTIFRKNTYP